MIGDTENYQRVSFDEFGFHIIFVVRIWKFMWIFEGNLLMTICHQRLCLAVSCESGSWCVLRVSCVWMCRATQCLVSCKTHQRMDLAVSCKYVHQRMCLAASCKPWCVLQVSYVMMCLASVLCRDVSSKCLVSQCVWCLASLHLNVSCVVMCLASVLYLNVSGVLQAFI